MLSEVSPPMVCPGAHGYVHQGKEYGGGVARGAELNPSTNRLGHHCMRTYTMISGCSICSGLLRSSATMCPHHAKNNQTSSDFQSHRLYTEINLTQLAWKLLGRGTLAYMRGLPIRQTSKDVNHKNSAKDSHSDAICECMWNGCSIRCHHPDQ